jgi:glycosyltransferase involved in cell wall biosynthesis
MRRLLVVLLEPLSDLIAKGEVVSRYYNPGDVFEDVHFLLLNADRPDAGALQRMCGRAAVSVHNLVLAPGLFKRTLGWRPELMGRELSAGVEIARGITPDLVRTHGAGLNGLFANAIGKALARPVLLSLHNRPDAVIASGAGDWLRQKALQFLAARVLRDATAVMAVYKAQLGYLAGLGVEATLAYNMTGSPAMPVKSDYSAKSPLHAISVGRQFPGKDISNVLAAVTELPELHLTVIGDGPLHEALVHRVRAAGLEARVSFRKAIANEELCGSLHTYDVFVSHNLHPGIPKAVMEPMLAGVPVIMNRIGGRGDADLDGAAVLVEDSVAGYKGALIEMTGSEARRREVGLACRKLATSTWEPVEAEARQAALTRQVLDDAVARALSVSS